MFTKIKLPQQLRPFQDVIYFVIILLVCHLFWKFFIIGVETSNVVTFLGLDISAPFKYASSHVAFVSHKVLQFLGYNTILYANNVIQHSVSLHGATIIWGCTAIKQAYIFFCIILFYKGSFKHKLWYIPLGFLLIYLFNIVRIVFVIAVLDKHPEQFSFWHEHVTKYLFYLFIFGLWVFWNERMVEKE